MKSARAVKKALHANKVTETPIDGGSRLEVVRGECRAKFDLYPDHVNWVSLTSPGEEGWVADAHDMARKLFPKLGVEYLVAGAGSDEAEKTLKAHGDWKDSTYRGKPRLRWDLA